MHEATIAVSILDHLVSRIDRSIQPVVAEAVYVSLGEFRNVDPESLKFAFDSLKREFPSCESCYLELKTIKATAVCRVNEHTYHASPMNAFRCEQCGSGIGRLVSGEELDITAITLTEKNNMEVMQNARFNN